MANYNFGKAKSMRAEKPSGADVAKPNALDFSGLPKAHVEVSAADEQKAIKRGEGLGFVDRGQGTTRRKRPSKPQKGLFIKGPEEIIEWLVDYCNDRNHTAYWNAIEDLKSYVERGSQ